MKNCQSHRVKVFHRVFDKDLDFLFFACWDDFNRKYVWKFKKI